MATYDFLCEMCTAVKEVDRSITDLFERVPYCDECTIPMRRIYSPTPAIFKGKGWGGSK